MQALSVVAEYRERRPGLQPIAALAFQGDAAGWITERVVDHCTTSGGASKQGSGGAYRPLLGFPVG